MTKIYLLNNITILLAIIVICAISEYNCVISDKRLCYDEKCSEPVSLARTLVRYSSIEPHVLSFPINTEVIIFSKEAGRRPDLWGAQIHGKRGYVPKSLVREYKTINSNLTYEVATEYVEEEINGTDKVKVAKKVPAENENVDPKSKNVKEESVARNDVENKIFADKSKTLQDPKSKSAETVAKNFPTAEDSPKFVAEKSDEQKADKIFEGIQSVTPSFEVSDGKTLQDPKSKSAETVAKNFPTAEDSPKSVAEKSDEQKADKIFEGIQSVTPSFEVSDGKTLQDPKSKSTETVAKNFPTAEDSPKSVAEKSDEQKADKIFEGIQSVTPSFEVIDGTTIPLLEDVAIKPSYSTPIIAATVKTDEEPILSVHPKLPSNGRPLISRFSNSDSKTIVDEQSKPESNHVVENETGETGLEKNPVPAEDPVDDLKNQRENINRENNDTNELNSDVQGHTSIDVAPTPTDSEEPDENSTGNDEERLNSKEDDQNESHSSDNPVQTAADTNAGETTVDEKLEALQNVTDDLELENVSSKEDETVGDGSEAEVDSDDVDVDEDEPKPDETQAEILENKANLEGTIIEEKLQDSKDQTEYLPDKNVISANNENPDKDESVENSAIEEDEISLTNETVEQHDDPVVANDSTSDSDENIAVNSVNDVQADSNSEDHPQDDPEKVETIGENVASIFTGEGEIPTGPIGSLEKDETSLDSDNQSSIETPDVFQPDSSETQLSQEYEYENDTYREEDSSVETPELEITEKPVQTTWFYPDSNEQEAPQDVCDVNSDCADLDNGGTSSTNEEEENAEEVEGSNFYEHNYLETLLYVSITAFTTLLFSLGYYYIENRRRDKELVAKINLLEKELLVTTKESMILDEGLKATKYKLNSIEDESFGSNEMVASLKSELEAAQMTKGELEDQIISLEKELESATEAGLELERMLREFLASQSDENPLEQSVEDLQTRLNAQQATNESLTNSLNLKSQENETLTSELAVNQERCQQLEVEVTRLSGELRTLNNLKTNAEIEFSTKITQLNKQVNKLSEDRAGLIAQLTAKEMALNDLSEVIKQQSTNNLDFDKLYDVSYIKAEAELVTKERDELKIKLTEVEGAHQLLEEHMKLIKEEIASVTEQYELAERDKTEAQTRLEVLSNYFKEKESQLQKELGMQEAMWVQKQGEVTSTVDRIQTMQNEIQNYKQQIETLKREILDQEREYKSQIAALETKSHEQWVISRQSERRLEESKAEASQLRHRLTMVEKSMNEVDPDTKLHRLETNGETAASPQLFMGGESSSSPIIFTGSSGVPPLPPSYMYGGPIPPPFIPPPPHSGGGPMYDISRRPPPLGGRLSSPPPIPPLHHPPGRYEDANSPPPLSPPLHPPYNHRSPPPFSNERIHPHPPPPFLPPLGTSHSWGDEPLPPLRNPAFHPHQRDQQRIRNHKGSLHSSGDSLDKTNHTGKS